VEKRILCSCSMNDTMFEYRQTRRIARYNAVKSETRDTRKARYKVSDLDMKIALTCGYGYRKQTLQAIQTETPRINLTQQANAQEQAEKG